MLVLDLHKKPVVIPRNRHDYGFMWRKNRRERVLDAYGNSCECCGELEQDFLEAHHKNGGGNEHRRKLGGGAKLYGWLKQNNWPKEFGLLCSNCNKAEYKHGICPHKLQKLEEERAA